ncbi:MAG: hypothetical protein VSS52_003050, partial [Thiotrichaceae bacterium]|nr:hypothetical protein [Thiotrichaceae bacterium]
QSISSKDINEFRKEKIEVLENFLEKTYSSIEKRKTEIAKYGMGNKQVRDEVIYKKDIKKEDY